MPLYEIGIMGAPSDEQAQALEDGIAGIVEPFGLRIGEEIVVRLRPARFEPAGQTAAAVVFFGGENAPQSNLQELLKRSVPILPVASELRFVRREIPPILLPLNGLGYQDVGPNRIASALLECIGLLPRQRRVFVSYRRDEAGPAALQLFNSLSARLFDVFLDTHGIAPGEDFQARLWHRLCDSDVLVMLDTPTYFDSRWTDAEFGRALAKGIAILQISWPASVPSRRTETATRLSLGAADLDSAGHLSDAAVNRVCLLVEAVRSRSHAVRMVSLVSGLKHAVERIGGSMEGVGASMAISLRLGDGRGLLVYPAVGVPTSTTLHDAAVFGNGASVAVAYDPVGLHPQWQGHLDWLAGHIHVARWLKTTEAAWQLADWRP